MNINALISKLFGNKSDHDMREIQPYVEEIKKVYEEIDLLDNDSLRKHTKTLQEKVQHCADDLREEINGIKAKTVRTYSIILTNWRKMSWNAWKSLWTR